MNKYLRWPLGLQPPWEVGLISFTDQGGVRVLEIEINHMKDHERFKYSEGKSIIHDRVERCWRHLYFFEHQCYLKCKVPRVKDEEGKVETVQVPWARKGSGFTLMFEAYCMTLIENEMPVNKVGKILKEYPKRIWTIFNYWLGISCKEADHEGIKNLGIDKTSSKKVIGISR